MDGRDSYPERRELFQIGEIAELFHLSVGSLRHYEKLGLVRPEYVDGETGYRYYSTRQFECLNTIRYLRVLGMPLARIEGFLKNRNVEKMQEMLRQQQEAVIRRQRELRSIERKIGNRLEQLRDALTAEKDTVLLKRTGPRRIAWLRRDFSLDRYLNPDFEATITRLGGPAKDSVVFLGKVGAGISAERLAAGQYDRYNLAFLLLDDEDEYAGPLEELPEETCVSVVFCGGHWDAPAYYRRLAEYMDGHHLRITGFSKEITMIDFGLTSDVNQFVTEIQIPVGPA